MIDNSNFRNIREIVKQNWDISKGIDKNTEINTLNHILHLAKQVQERPMLFYICC